MLSASNEVIKVLSKVILFSSLTTLNKTTLPIKLFKFISSNFPPLLSVRNNIPKPFQHL